jgi:hypothetical protein
MDCKSTMGKFMRGMLKLRWGDGEGRRDGQNARARSRLEEVPLDFTLD